MARVLLIQPPLVLHADFIDYPSLAGLGLWQAAAGLRAAGHDPAILDAFCLAGSNLVHEPGGLVRLGVTLAGLLHHLPERPPEIVVVAHSPWLRARPATAELARLSGHLRARWPGVALVLADVDIGGMHYIEWDEADLDETGFDFGQKYEAEATLPQLVATLAAGQAPAARITAAGPGCDDLDSLPLPAYDLVDVAAFQRFLDRVDRAAHRREVFSHRPPLMGLKTSRGCAFRCAFCTSNPWLRAGHAGRAWRSHGPEYLERHARLLRDVYGITRLVVLDELANATPEGLDGLLDVLERLDLRVDFPNGLRADRLTRSQVRRLAARTDLLSISAESATDRVANGLIGKRFDIDATARVAAWAREDGLRLAVHWMVGHPDETRAEIRATLDAAVRLHDETGAEPLVQFAIPIRGTTLHREVTARNLWTTREERDIGPLFQGRPIVAGPDWTPHELWIARKVLEARVAAARPRKVIVNTTYVCNNHCEFCATGNRDSQHGDPEAQIAFLRERRSQGYDLVDFDGGEPTTNPHLLRLVATARDLGYREINLTTNGRMLSVARNAERIVRSGITHLLVSLHGPNAAIHEANVRAAGAFAQTTGGIALARPLAERHGVGFGVNVTLTRSNTPHMLELGELMTQLGVRLCNLQFLTPFGRASAECQPDPALAAQTAMALIDRYGDKIRFQIINLPLCFLPGREEHGLSDIGKLERHMVFVGGEDVNLFDYLQARRRHEAACASCLYAIACQGFYFWPDEWSDDARQRFGD